MFVVTFKTLKGSVFKNPPISSRVRTVHEFPGMDTNQKTDTGSITQRSLSALRAGARTRSRAGAEPAALISHLAEDGRSFHVHCGHERSSRQPSIKRRPVGVTRYPRAPGKQQQRRVSGVRLYRAWRLTGQRTENLE